MCINLYIYTYIYTYAHTHTHKYQQESTHEDIKEGEKGDSRTERRESVPLFLSSYPHPLFPSPFLSSLPFPLLSLRGGGDVMTDVGVGEEEGSEVGAGGGRGWPFWPQKGTLDDFGVSVCVIVRGVGGVFNKESNT